MSPGIVDTLPSTAAPLETTRRTRSLARRRSLRFQLPMMMSAAIAAVLGTFLWVAFTQVRTTLIEAGGARAQNASAQLADLLAQSAQLRVTELQAAARSEAVGEYLRHPDEASEAAARERLTAVAAPGQLPVDLVDVHGAQLLTVTRPAPADAAVPVALPSLPPMAPPFRPGLAPFKVAGPAVFWEVVTEVRDARLASGTAGALQGYLLTRRLLSLTSTSDVIGRLVVRRGGHDWQSGRHGVDGPDQNRRAAAGESPFGWRRRVPRGGWPTPVGGDGADSRHAVGRLGRVPAQHGRRAGAGLPGADGADRPRLHSRGGCRRSRGERADHHAAARSDRCRRSLGGG